MGSGGGRGEDGGGSGASGAARRTPPTPRLSTFLRTFGTTLAARAGVDVDAEYVSRRAILDARVSAAGSSSTTTSSSSSTSGARGTATAPLARSVCGPGVAPDRDARDALEAFLQAVVRVSGGDTLLPDQLADASLAAFDAVAHLCVSSAAADARWTEEAAYARDPDLARRRGEAESREWTRKKKKALADAIGPVAEQHFPAFDRAAHALVAMRDERTDGGGGGGDRGRGEPTRRDEFGADWDFVPPGAGGTRTPPSSSDPSSSVPPRAGSTLAASMRAGLAAASDAEDRRRREDAAAFADGVSPLDVADGAVGGGAPAAEASATEQLTWLKARCVEVSGSDSWEETATGVARALLSGGESTSDDVVASELFDLLGDAGVELVMGVVERRGAMTAAFRRRLTTLRDRLGGAPGFGGDDGDKKFGGGSGAPGATVTITSTTDKKLAALRRKEERKAGRRLARGEGEPLLEWLASAGVGISAICEGDWEAPAPRATEDDIFDALRGLGGGVGGGRKALPAGTTRKVHEGYEEVCVPAAARAPPGADERFVSVDEFEPWARLAFAGISSLNRIQSRIYEAAYRSNENLLVCAPTGAGKTNIAMMTVLREIARHVDEEGAFDPRARDGEDFKIVYVAPMKALAAEVTGAFSRRLAPLGITVRELTGDTQLSKKELEETQMIVTTPEKWDVITRKGGEVSVASALRLLVIDEVHLLNDERGPVIETLVARTHRQVETSQSMIRIVGLSATLPNPDDVAKFLGVGDAGLFVFDQSFRPIPLTQMFVGVTETNAMKRANLMAEVAYRKCAGALRSGKQAMVFVHSRKDTVKTARQLAELAANDADGHGDLFSRGEDHPDVARFQAEVNKSRNPEVKELFAKGFGCHNAGMLRSDRSLVERMFAAGVVKTLVCTATLAWGVNLPAHTVVIKGTTLYDPQRGGFRDLGVLDVQQIFGRAGRPGFDTSGEGVIVTEHKKLAHYLALLTHSTPIESQFISNLADNLNAEVVLGTVTNVREGAQWLGYSYLHTRMEKNPLAYGLTWEEARLDPGLAQHRRKLIREAARTLDRAKMVRFDERSGQLYQTEAGRIASHFYIKQASMEIFDEHLRRHMSMPEVLHMVSHASEFENIAPREDEMPELESLQRDRKRACPIEIKATMADKTGKVNLLLQVYVSRARMEAFSLVADSSYISQNASRICRALFELCLRRGWPSLAETLLTLSKAVDQRIWPHQHTLRQFEATLSPETLHKLEERKATVERLWDMSPSEIGSMLRLNTDVGRKVKACVEALPHLGLEATVQPITRSVLRVGVTLTPDFVWRDSQHGGAQRWLVWVEDPVNEHIYHTETFTLSKKQHAEGPQHLAFTIPIFEPMPPQYFLRATSESWLGCETFHELNFEGLVLPDKNPPHTDLLDLTPLPRSALNNPAFEALYERKFTHFNAIQTQAFHTLYHQNCNVLLGAPTGSGKTISAELAMMKVFRDAPAEKVVYIAPLKALVRERIEDWRKHLCPKLGKRLVELTGDYTPDLRALLNADIIVATPEKWDGISRNWRSRAYVTKVALVVIDEIHLLGGDRGPILEVIVSRMRYISSRTKKPVRIVGLSTALANAHDLGDWLGIEKEGLFNFRPSVRPVPLECHIQGFPGKFYCPRMMTMNKPTYAAIRTHSPEKPALVFVSSRRQTRLTAMDLIAYAAADERPDGFVHMSSDELASHVARTKDAALRHCLQFGVGLHHAGLSVEDRAMCERLFAECKIQVLVCTSTLAWGVNLPAHLVVIKGTEFYDGKTRRYVDFPITDALQMMGRAGRPQFDKSGVCVIMCHEPKKAFYKKFLYEPFPVESSLAEALPDHFNAEIVAGTIASKQDAVDWVTWTYFFRRLVKNPSYYDLESVEHEALNAFLSALVENALAQLEDARCVATREDDGVEPLLLGRVASYYYLKHASVALFAANLGPENSVEELLRTLCGVAEYDELPVRHNEDKVNAELARRVEAAGGYAVDARLADDPHTKANLLFQAHFLRLELPMSDYVTDAKGVIDQSVRILQAMIDVAADAGWLATALGAMNLMQMVMQGRHARDPSLVTMPRVDFDHAEKLAGRGVETLPHLAHLAQTDPGRAKDVLRAAGVRGNAADETVALAARLPLVDVAATRVSLGGGPSGEDACVEITLRRFKPGKRKGEGEGEGEDARRRSGAGGGGSAPRAVCPRYPKIKEEGWWLVLGDRTSRELLALRRVSFGDRATTKLTYEPTPPGAPEDLVVYLMSDCYLGMDQEVEISAAGRVELRGTLGEGEKGEGRGKRNGKNGASREATLAGGGKVPAPRGGKGSSSKARREGVESFDVDAEDEDGFWLDAAGVAAATAERKSNPTPNKADEADDDDDDDFWEAPDDDPFFWEGEVVHLEDGA